MIFKIEAMTRIKAAGDKWIAPVQKKEDKKTPAEKGDFPEGFWNGSASSIASGLKAKSKDLKQAMSRLNFYINRGGENLSDADKSRLEGAKDALHKAYGEK